MKEQPLHAAIRYLRSLAAVGQEAEASDAELLRRFVERHEETGFAELVRRHGPMVREVSRRLLGQHADIEDVFQVVFLVLACKARSVRKRQSLAGWLYGIAYRTALRVRRDAARRKNHERRATVREPSDPAWDAARREVWEVLDAELHRLPEGQRSALVLCYLEGRTRDEAARQLSQSVRTLDRQLQRGRELLRRRLARRGVTLSAALLGLGLTQNIAGASVPARLGALTTRAAIAVMMGQGPAGHEVSVQVIALMKGVLWNMLQTRIKIVTVSLLTLTLLGTATGFLAFRATAQDSTTQSPPAPARADAPAPAKRVPGPDVYALLLIEDAEPRLLPDARQAALPWNDPVSYRKTQSALLMCRPTIQSALRRDEVKRLAIVKEKTEIELVRWLDQNLETTILDNTGMLRVSLGEGSPQERAVLINAIVDAYMDNMVYAEQQEKQKRVMDLEKALNDRKAELKAKREALLRSSVERGDGSLSLRRQSDQEELAELRKELLRVRLAKAGALGRFKHWENEKGEEVKATLAKLKEELAALTEQEKLLKQDLGSLKERAEKMANIEAHQREELRSLREDIAAEEQFCKEMANRFKTYQVELLARPRIRVLQRAEAPSKRP
ncbi:MAG TPA: sigma-70 family RNA polymerase sigma factor [Gemmataceae bacterium]